MNISENSQDTNDPCWHNIISTWTDHVLRLDKDFGINYKGNGWYNHYGNRMLINKTLTGFHVMVWNADPRPLLRNILEAEIRT